MQIKNRPISRLLPWEKQFAAKERIDLKELQIVRMHFKYTCKVLHKT